MPRLSIIIPFYNVEQYIAQCLDSVYAQDVSEEEYEVICVDDCSPDNSISIVAEYAKKHSNLVIVRNKINRKLGGARNAGMEVATGRYVWFVDSDDFIEKNCVGELLSIAENEDLDMLHFNYVEYPDTNQPNRRPIETNVMTGTEMFFDINFIWYNDLITAWRKLYKRQFLIDNNIQFAEHIMFEDNDYAIVAFANAQRVKHVACNAYYYRNNPESITRVKYNKYHIYYCFDLAYRLINLKDVLCHKQVDIRFVDIISSLIRYSISNSINVYRSMEESIEKKEVRLFLKRGLKKTLAPYMSIVKYCKIKLGVL